MVNADRRRKYANIGEMKKAGEDVAPIFAEMKELSNEIKVDDDKVRDIDAKLRANRDYADRMAFGRKCLMNVASAAKFSSDRTIRQYAEEIWHINPTQF